MRLAVVTVNYCCADEVLRGLAGTAAQITAAGGEWWIVDNKSPDDSIARLRPAIAGLAHVHLIEAPLNGGFGYGNNQVVNRVLSGEIDAEYLYFLNPDAIPEQGAIELMASYLDGHPRVGVVGSGLLNEDGSHADSMFRFPSVWSEIESAVSFGPVSRLLSNHRVTLPRMSEPGPVGWVSGSSFMVRTAALRKVGGFDEDFFLYWEEVELCHRIARAGFEIHGLPDARVCHIGGVATGVTTQDPRFPAFWHQSRNLYFRKTGAPVFALNLVTGLSLAARRMLQFVRRKPFTNPAMLRDHIRHSFGPGSPTERVKDGRPLLQTGRQENQDDRPG